ncbi:MAG: universal stress protein [Elainellaceae cyanobacterium]
MFERILVALDTSPHNTQVFDTALSLAKLTNARLLLTHILPNFNSSDSEIGKPAEPESVPAHLNQQSTITLERQAAETKGLAMLRSFHRLAQSAHVGADLAQPLANPSEMICSLVCDWGADLVVMGRRGLTEADEAFLSSVSTYVTHHAACPVLIVQSSQCPNLGVASINTEAITH